MNEQNTRTRGATKTIKECPHESFNPGTLEVCESGCGQPRLYVLGYWAGAVSVDRRKVVERIENLKSIAKPEDDPYGCTPTWNAALDKAIAEINGEENE